MKDNRAKSFVTIMIVIALCALFLRIAIERIIKFTSAQNESNAQVTLKLISTALENYAKDNRGLYPTEFSSLTEPKPPYLEKDYTQNYFKGYNFSCPRLEPSGYTCYAQPMICRITGNITYSVTTAGLMVSEKCDRKD